MSEVVENVSEQNSAQSKEAAAPPTEDVTINNVEAAVKAVPEAETGSSAVVENAVDSGLKEAVEKSSPKADIKKTPVKRTPSKRVSYIERAQKESEELVKNMGGSLEVEGGRKTRSSTRGTPTRSAVASTPPPVKKARTSPASGASTPTRPRGRGRKIDVAEEAAEEEEFKATPSKKKTPTKGKKAAAKEGAEDEDVAEAPEGAKDVEKKSQEKEEKADSIKSDIAVDESNESTASNEQTNKTTNVVDQPEEDKTDAFLETVVEETQSQVAADLISTGDKITKEPENKNASFKVVSEESESVKSDSPMETEDVKPVENVTKGKTMSDADGVKEPTPEPMEIDSSPHMDDDVVEIIDEAEVVENQQSTAELTNMNNIEKVGENIKENSVTLPADIVVNNSIAKSATVTDVANTNATNDVHKTENDLCEPKIATSPPISAANDNSTVTTPQTCN